jgi:hypothetical protein
MTDHRPNGAATIRDARAAHLREHAALGLPVRIDRPSLDRGEAGHPYRPGMVTTAGPKNSPVPGGAGPRPRPGPQEF